MPSACPFEMEENMLVQPFFIKGWSRLSGLLLLGMLLASTVTRDAAAQGFSVYEHGTCATGRAGATVASTCDDGSAVFYNPAGIVSRTGLTISVGTTVIAPFGEFTDDETDRVTELENDPSVVPHVYATYGFNERLAAGLGVYVPYGLGTQWPLDFEGRFLGYDNSLQSIYVQPTVAYRVTEQLSIGAGLTYVIAGVELNRRLDLSQQAVPGAGLTFQQLGVPVQTDFADAKIESSGSTGIGGHFGVQFRATDRVNLGARYLLPVKIEYEGDAEFEQIATGLSLPQNPALGPLSGAPIDAVLLGSGIFGTGGALGAQTGTTEITMPAQFVAGASFQATSSLALFADYQWSGWSSFEEINVDLENAPDLVQYEGYSDTHALRLGAEYALNDAWKVRGGFLTHGAAAPDETVTPLLPEASRMEFTIGLGWQPVPSVEINAAYQYLGQQDRDGRVIDAPEGQRPTTDLNSGVYSFGANIVAATLTVRL